MNANCYINIVDGLDHTKNLSLENRKNKYIF